MYLQKTRYTLFQNVNSVKLKPLPEIVFLSFCHFFRQKCKNPHSLDSPYNAQLLKRYGLHDLTGKQLFQLLLQNDPYLLPEVGFTGKSGK